MSILTLEETKDILNLKWTSDYDDSIKKLIPIVQDWIIEYCNNSFEVKRKYPVDYYDDRFTHRDVIYLYSNTISFDGDAKTIADSDSNFVNAGFRKNFSIRVQDSTYNDGVYDIQSVVAGTITLSSDDSLIDEDSGYYTLLTLVKFPKGIKIPAAKIIAEELKNDSVQNPDQITSESVGNASFNYSDKSLRGEYPKSLLRQFKPFKRVKFV